jgi:hypothetical protein
MSFIDKFLDVTTNLPREIIRLLKLYKFVEERCKNIKNNLTELRMNYIKEMNKLKELNQLKGDEPIDERILATNNKYYKELLNLSEYKQNLIKELEYILDKDFLKKIAPIIEEGQKELKDESTMANGINSNYNKNTLEDKSTLINSEKNKKNEKLLGNKTNRQNKNNARKKNLTNIEYYDENAQNGEEHYCICEGKGDGKMIECDSCFNWYHFKCIGKDESFDPDSWICDKCSEKLENNINNGNNKTKKKEKNNKKKKYNKNS